MLINGRYLASSSSTASLTATRSGSVPPAKGADKDATAVSVRIGIPHHYFCPCRPVHSNIQTLNPKKNCFVPRSISQVVSYWVFCPLQFFFGELAAYFFISNILNISNRQAATCHPATEHEWIALH